MRRWRLAIALLVMATASAFAVDGLYTPVQLNLNPAADTQVRITNATRYPSVVASSWLASGQILELPYNSTKTGYGDPYTYETQYKSGGVWVAGLSGTFTVPLQSTTYPVNIDVVPAAPTSLTTVTTLTHDGQPLPGVEIYYNQSGWRYAGKTGSAGTLAVSALRAGNEVLAQLGGTGAKQTVGSSGPVFYSTLMDVSVAKGDGSPLSGSTIYYNANGWRYLGNTTSTGKLATPVELFQYAGMTWQAQYRNSAETIAVDPVGDGKSPNQAIDVSFAAKTITINTCRHDGTSLDGVTVYYNLSGWVYVGNTSSGKITTELLGDDSLAVPFELQYRGTATDQTVTIGSRGGTFYTSAMQATVRNSAGVGISGSTIYYNTSGWTYVGNTGADGTIIAEVYPQAMDVQAQLGGSNKTQKVTTLGGDPSQPETPEAKTFPVVFYTTKVSVKALGSDGTGISGVTVYYNTDGWHYAGNTDAAGIKVVDLFPSSPSTVTWQAQLAGGAANQTTTNLNGVGDGLTAGKETTVIFGVTKVTLWAVGTVYHKSGTTGGWNYFGKPTKYLLPGTYTFNFNPGSSLPAVSVDLTVPATTTEWTVAYLRLRDSLGAGLAGGTGRGGSGSSYGSWFVGPVNSTNSDGVMVDVRPGKLTSASYEMTYNGTTQVVGPQDPTTKTYAFQTMLLTLRLQKSDGSPINGGQVRYGSGASYTTRWWPGGSTGSSAAGETAAQLFTGTYSFGMNYAQGEQPLISQTVTPTNAKLVWTTTPLTLYFKYDIAYGGSGDNAYFGKPTSELLPGTYNFNFRAPGCNAYLPIKVETTPQSYSVAVERVVNSSGALVAPDSAPQWYASGWKDAAKSSKSDAYVALIPSTSQAGTLAFRAVLGGGSLQLSQNLATDPLVTFKATGTTVTLVDSTGIFLPGGKAYYYASGWHEIGEIPAAGASVQLLPGTYAFRVDRDGASYQKSATVGATATTVPFATLSTPVVLVGATGGKAYYYASGWHEIGDTDATVELLPGTYAFRVDLGGASYQQSAAAGTTVTFTAATTTVELLSSDGASDLGGTAYYYASGWHAMGITPSATAQLLPGTYAFRVDLNGASYQKSATIPADGGKVTFQAVATTVKLLNTAGDEGLVGKAYYYASGWHEFGDTPNATVDLLPGTYAFRMDLGGASQQTSAAAGGAVTFRTGLGKTAKYTQYYASGWKAFASESTELLPGTYAFTGVGVPQVSKPIVAGTTTSLD